MEGRGLSGQEDSRAEGAGAMHSAAANGAHASPCFLIPATTPARSPSPTHLRAEAPQVEAVRALVVRQDLVQGGEHDVALPQAAEALPLVRLPVVPLLLLLLRALAATVLRGGHAVLMPRCTARAGGERRPQAAVVAVVVP